MTNPVLRVLAGEAVWPPPIWLMRQAGRYLPEYRALRGQAGDFISLCTTPALAAEVTLQPIRRFGFDAAILFSDILILPWALGYGLDFGGRRPGAAPFRDEADLGSLDPARLQSARSRRSWRRSQRCRAGLPPETTLIGFAGSPFTVACYMVEGGGSKEFAAIRDMAHAQPALLDRLIDDPGRQHRRLPLRPGRRRRRGPDAVRQLGRRALPAAVRPVRDRAHAPHRRHRCAPGIRPSRSSASRASPAPRSAATPRQPASTASRSTPAPTSGDRCR